MTLVHAVLDPRVALQEAAHEEATRDVARAAHVEIGPGAMELALVQVGVAVACADRRPRDQLTCLGARFANPGLIPGAALVISEVAILGRSTLAACDPSAELVGRPRGAGLGTAGTARCKQDKRK